jgi:hypothetical protein
MSSGTKRSGPSAPPIRIDGIRPQRAASYTHARETASIRAMSLGRSSGGPSPPSLIAHRGRGPGRRPPVVASTERTRVATPLQRTSDPCYDISSSALMRFERAAPSAHPPRTRQALDVELGCYALAASASTCRPRSSRRRSSLATIATTSACSARARDSASSSSRSSTAPSRTWRAISRSTCALTSCPSSSLIGTGPAVCLNAAQVRSSM